MKLSLAKVQILEQVLGRSYRYVSLHQDDDLARIFSFLLLFLNIVQLRRFTIVKALSYSGFFSFYTYFDDVWNPIYYKYFIVKIISFFAILFIGMHFKQ